MRTSTELRIAKAVVATEDDRDRMALLTKLRKGDILTNGDLVARVGEHIAVFDLRAFGPEREDWLTGLRAITKRKAFVVQIDRANGHPGLICGDAKGAELLAYTLDREKADKHMPAERSARIAAARRAERQSRTMPEADAAKIWFNPRLLVKEALGLMSGWKQPTAYREFGKRSAPDGLKAYLKRLAARHVAAAKKSK
jgi:hypothetical protein